jgi:hypothetical protein
MRFSIKTRMEVKPYFFVIFLSMSFIVLALLAKANQTNTTVDFWLFFIPYMLAPTFFMAYMKAYRQEEKTVFLLDRFIRDIDLCKGYGDRLSVRDLENALKAYQKTLPTFCSLDGLRTKLKQIKLILDRGSKQEICKVQEYLYHLSKSIREGNAPSFDKYFFALGQFLNEAEDDRKGIIQITGLTRKEKVSTYITTLGSLSLKKVLPLIFVAIVIYVIYVLSGIKLSVP